MSEYFVIVTGKEKSITKVERNFQKRLKRLERLLREEASKEQKKTKKREGGGERQNKQQFPFI